MKKILLTLGAAASVAAPIAAVISCGSKTTPTTGGNGTNNGGNGDGQDGIENSIMIHADQIDIEAHRMMIPIDATSFVNQFSTEHISQFVKAIQKYVADNASFDQAEISEVIIKATVSEEIKFYQAFVKPGHLTDPVILKKGMQNMAPPTDAAPISGELTDITMAQITAQLGKVQSLITSTKPHEELYGVRQIREGHDALVNWEQLGIPAHTYYSIAGTAFIMKVKSPLGILDTEFTIEFKLFSIKNPNSIVGTKDVIIRQANTPAAESMVDLTFSHESVWHGLFRGPSKHRKTPQIGQTLYIDVEGTNYGFTWTEQDSTFPIMESYLKHDATQKAVLNYLAQRIVAANPLATITRQQVWDTFGDATTNIAHIVAAEPMPTFENVPTSGLASGVTLPVLSHELVEITGALTALEAGWHKLFTTISSTGHLVRTLPKVGTTIYMTDAHGKNYGFTWTTEDSKHETMRRFLSYQRQQIDVIRYVAYRIQKANPQAPAINTFNMVMPIINGNHNVHQGVDQLGPEPAGIISSGVEHGVVLPSDRYQFSDEKAALTGKILNSSMTMANLKTVIDSSQTTSNPVALTTNSIGLTPPAILATNGVTIKSLKCTDAPYGAAADANMEITLEKVDTSGWKDTFTTTFKLHATDGPYNFSADETVVKGWSLAVTSEIDLTMLPTDANGEIANTNTSISGFDLTNISHGTTVTFKQDRSWITGSGVKYVEGSVVLSNGTWVKQIAVKFTFP